MVEAAGLEPTVSSSRTAIFMFFEHYCLHIIRIFRKTTPFCTFVPLFPYRTIPVVVSYVVKPKIRLKAENGEPDKAFFTPLTNRTRVKKYARNIRLFCCILTLKRRKSKSFR